MPVKWKTLTDGEWADIIDMTQYIGCCDCGLVHLVNFRRYKGKLQYAAWRDRRKTSARRREGNKRGKYVATLNG